MKHFKGARIRQILAVMFSLALLINTFGCFQLIPSSSEGNSVSITPQPDQTTITSDTLSSSTTSAVTPTPEPTTTQETSVIPTPTITPTIVPEPTAAPKPTPTPTPSVDPTPVPDFATHLSYTVKAGDTLYAISVAFNVTVDVLAAVNHLSDPSLIYTGQVLIIPSESSDPEPPYHDNLDNTSIGWRFIVPVPLYQDKAATLPSNAAALVQKYHVIWQLPGTDQNVVYLTMDAGYEYGTNTSKILDIAADKGVKITFFVTGSFILHQPDLVMRMVNEGHKVGNHTERHLNQPDTLRESADTLRYDIQKSEQRFQSLTGQSFAPYLRPPSGYYSERTLAFLNNLGYKPVFWSFAYADWQTDQQPDPNFAYDKIMGQLHNGSVLLLHTVSTTNTAILGRLIDGIIARGYTFEMLP